MSAKVFSAKWMVLALALTAGLPSASWAQVRGAWSDAGLGIACVFTSVLYSSAKLLYAGAGTVTGVMAFALTGGRKDVMEMILDPALRGDYVITAEHLRHERPLVFVGPYLEDMVGESEVGEEPAAASSQRTPPYPF